MVFSSPVFIFLFFPISFLVYYLLRGEKQKNFWLLCCSLLFYAWSGLKFLAILLFSTVVNYCLGVQLSKKNRVVLWFSVLFNLSLLGYFKYSKFLVENLVLLIPGLNLDMFSSINNIVLPIGISFFTFQILAYDIDVYYQRVEPQKNYLKLLLYIIMYPQLIAGPIVRYIDVQHQISHRNCDLEGTYIGFKRFICGLGKKVLLADILGACTENIFMYEAGTIATWIGMITYSLQIYFDFSGYSDMAIGMGKMLGFDFLENFENPYKSRSIKEFWRRWHISLSSWFRDYLYIPLGGNRKGTIRTYRNLLLVFAATGLWHGASWNFFVWGLWHGLFLILERLGFSRILEKLPKSLQRIYTLLVVGIGWLMFRTENFMGNLKNISSLFIYRSSNFITILPIFDPKVIVCIIGSLAICIVGTKTTRFKNAIGDVVVLAIFILALLQISASDFSPFLYFRF